MPKELTFADMRQKLSVNSVYLAVVLEDTQGGLKEYRECQNSATLKFLTAGQVTFLYHTKKKKVLLKNELFKKI